MQARVNLLLTAFAVAVLAYKGYVKAPDFVVNVPQWYAVTSSLKLLNLLGSGLEYLGLSHKVTPSQKISVLASNFLAEKNSSDVRIDEEIILGVRTLVLKPNERRTSKNGKQAVFLYFHGGGYTKFSPELYSGFLANMARRTGVIVYAPDYRKAPQHVFPAAFQDCFAVAKHILAGKMPEADPKRVVIGGDSAGGQLAAAVVQQLKLDKLQLPMLQILIYPIVQFANYRTSSYDKNFDGILDNVGGYECGAYYLTGSTASMDAIAANAHSSEAVAARWLKVIGGPLPRSQPISKDLFKKLEPIILDHRVSPLLTEDLKGLPPTFLITAEHDPLQWEGLQYGLRLKQAGNKVEHKLYRTYHGALTIKGDGDSMQNDIQKALKKYIS